MTIKVAKTASPAAKALLKQATAISPKRNKASDGLLPSAAHLKQNPNSDHNTGLAVDLTHDPKNGIDCTVIFQKLKADPRVAYLIFNGKIWSRARAKEGDRRYTGPNPHNHHLHVSIEPTLANDVRPWFAWMNQPKLVNQIRAAVQPTPTKKVATAAPAPVCTCCPVHNPNRKAI